MSEGRAAVVALHLAQHGRPVHAGRVLELASGALDAPAITGLLRRHGVPVRCIGASPHVLQSLLLPTLLDLHEGGLCILEAVDGPTAVIRAADDALRRTSTRKLEADLACAFERLPIHDMQTPFAPGLRAHLWEQSRELWQVGLTVVALALLGPLVSWLTRLVIDHALGDRSESLLSTVVVALSFVALVRGWLRWLRARISIALEARLLRAATPFAFGRLLALPFRVQEDGGFAAQWAALSSAELSARGTAELAVEPIVEALTMLGFVVALTIASPTVGGVLATCTTLSLIVAYALARWRAQADVETVREAAVARERLHDLVEGVATIKSEHGERTVLLRWIDALLRERGVCLTRDLREGWLSLWLLLGEQAMRMFVLCYGAQQVMAGKETLPGFLYLTMLSEGLIAPLTACCQLLTSGLTVQAHTERVDQLLGGTSTEPIAAHLSAGPALGTEVVRMSDVWFRHGPDQPWVLRGYDLTVHEGEHHVLCGVSGAGKTTILRLIAGLYRPERGTVAVCGGDPARNRREVRYLPQQAQLFAGSLRDNLEQLSGAGLSEIMAAADRTGLSGWLATLPMGIDTVVATQGASLSGGQRQWILLTAAVASRQKLILLDEAMSQLDHLLRARLDVSTLFAERTTVSVFHDT